MSKGTALTKLYSKLAREIEKAPLKQATGEEWTNYLRNRGVKQEELQNWQKALNNMPADYKMTPAEASEQFRVLGDVPVRETRLESGLDDYGFRDPFYENIDPKYGSEYSLAGAPENAYEELVLHSPWAEKLAADPSHYTDVPGGDQNIAWLRYHTRQLMNDQLPDKAALISDSSEFVPAKLFHLDELQSGRHQAGQKKGYYDPKREKALSEKLSEARKKYKDAINADENYSLSEDGLRLEDEYRKLRDEYNALPKEHGPNAGAPDAPFKGDNWKNLGLRRALLEAAERDADLFSWAPGKIQQQRWHGAAGEGTERFYDKDVPNILNKELKAHGATPEHFLQIPDPSKSYDTRELPQSLAALVSSTDDPPFLGHIAEFLDDFENNPSMMRRNLYNLGMHPDRISSAMDELENFSIARQSFLDDPELDMERVMDFGSEFVPQYLREGLSLNTQQLPAVRLTPEIRKSILEKGFPKYMFPLGAVGASMQQPEEPQGYAKGGLVKKGTEQLKELLENLHKADPERMARAKAAGFDVDNIYFHGSQNHLIDEDDDNLMMQLADKLYGMGYGYDAPLEIDDIYDNFKSFDPITKFKPNTYFTDNPEYASLFAREHGEVYPVFLKKGRIYDNDDVNSLEKFIKSNYDYYKAGESSTDQLGNLVAADAYQVFDPNNIKSIFNDFSARSLKSKKFAKGGYVEAKLGDYKDSASLDQDSIDNLRTAYLNWLHDATLGSDETTKATIGAMIAKGTRPELFEDTSLDTLIASAKANQQYERERLSEENPFAAIAGSLATMPLFMTMGGSSVLGQASTNVGAGAINRYMDEEDPLDPISLSIEAGLPAAIKYWRPAVKAATLSLPLLSKSDNSLLNFDNMAHTLGAP